MKASRRKCKPLKPYMAVVYGTLRSVPFRLHVKTERALNCLLRDSRDTRVVWL